MASVDVSNRTQKMLLLFSELQKETLTAIVDTFIAPLSANEEAVLTDKILDVPNTRYTREQLSKYAQISGSSSQAIEKIESKMSSPHISPKQRADFRMLLNLLSLRPTSLLLTGHWTLFKDLKQQEREQVLLKWRRSYFGVFKLFYGTLMGLTLSTSYLSTDTLLYNSIHHPGIEGGQAYFRQQPDYSKVKHERLHMLTTEEALQLKQVDVIVVGSGAGGGVAAAELSKAGLSVLVIEKGQYLHQDDMKPDDDEFAFANMFESGGFIINSTGSVSILAGSNFGGGTTINYLASLEPPNYIRKQWADLGLDHFESQQFQNDLDKVCTRLGVSCNNINHNRPNQKLMNGCRKLGLSVKTVPQNTSELPHHCGKCYTGCSDGIKNSTTNTWLKDAALNEAKFLDSTRVNRILIKNGKAVGIECFIHGSQLSHAIYSKSVVVAGGALHTPSLLIKSGLTNPNIGKDLRLHLSSLCVGIYDEDINPTEGSLLTSVCDSFENIEGTNHGFKVECFTNGLGVFSAMVPWDGAAKHKERMLRYRNAVITFAMMRDKDSKCSVKYDAHDSVDVDFVISKHDAANLKEGIVQMAKIHVAAGARQIHVSFHPGNSFEFEKDEESNVDNPRFLKWIQGVYLQEPPIPASGHQMASCRMGRSPKTSATKPNGETWDVQNLYVADSSLFPTSLGINPMVTIQTIALSVSRGIVQSFKLHQSKL